MKTFLVQYADVFDGPSKRWVQIEAATLEDAAAIADYRAYRRVCLVNRIVEI